METVILQNDHIETGGNDDIAAQGDENGTILQLKDMKIPSLKREMSSNSMGETKEAP